MKNNLISIIVPVYNVEKYLERCINSLMNQTYRNIEILLINDGSTDNSLSICKKFQKKDSRIKLFSQKNCGLSETRNVGIKNAKGKYVMFVDSDDWVELEMCEKLLDSLIINDCDVSFCSYKKSYRAKEVDKYIIDTNESSIIYNQEMTKKMIFRRFFGLYGEEIRKPEHMDSIVTAWGKLYKKSIISNIKFIDTSIIGTEDALFNIFVFYNVHSCCYVNDCLYHYWKSNSNSLTKNNNFTLLEKWNRLYSYMYDFIIKENLDDSFKKSLNNRIALNTITLGMNVMKLNVSYKNKLKLLNKILNNPVQRKALEDLDTNFFDLKWKVYFFFAKNKFVLSLSFLLKIMNYIVKG